MHRHLVLPLVCVLAALFGAGCPAFRSRQAPPPRAPTEHRAKTPPPEPTLRPAPEPARFVLLRSDAHLHRLAHAGLRRAHPAPSAPATPADARVYRLIADHGSWLEVESLPQTPPDQCHRADERLAGLALRLFVHRSELVEVLRTPLTQHYPDGTRLALAAGVGVSAALDFDAPTGESIRHVEVDGLSLNAETPDAAIGTDFAPQPLAGAPDNTGETLDLAPGTLLRYGLGARVRVRAPREALVLGTASSQHRIRVSSACADLTALLGSDRPRTPKVGAEKGPPVTSGGPGVAPGTLVTWPDGRVAGRAVHYSSFDRIVETTSKRICLQRDLPLFAGGGTHDDRAERLVVCAPRGAVLPEGH